MKKEYTPGPWKLPTLPRDIDRGIIWTSAGAGHGAICTLEPHCVCMKPKIRDANARLIHVAPEMADAIEAALPYLKQCNISGSHIVVEEIGKIIKKIKGDES